MPPFKENRKFISFDPTIHAGHVMTALTIIVCTVSAWIGLKDQVTSIRDTQVKQQQEIDKVIANASDDKKEIHADLQKLQDDNRQWFMRLDDKLDRKMDKKGM